MATEEIQISELELADEVLADMVLPVDTATDTKAVTLKQLKAWLGSSLPTGFIIPAVGKISDARFTLLDGKTLSRTGTYQAFCNKVVEQVQAGNWFACSEEEYNADISNFGQCGRFVIANDYVRIPKITRFIGATITLSEIGKSYAESLPNIRGRLRYEKNGYGVSFEASGALSSENGSGNAEGGGQAGRNQNATIIFNANDSSSTYKDGAKVQPDHVKFPYYMVVSSEGQTGEISVDINQVYEDLELKANSNLANLTAEGKSLASGLGMPSSQNIDLTLGASGSWYTAPANGWVHIVIDVKANGYLSVQDNYFQASGTAGYIGGRIAFLKGQEFYITYGEYNETILFKFYYAEGEK